MTLFSDTYTNNKLGEGKYFGHESTYRMEYNNLSDTEYISPKPGLPFWDKSGVFSSVISLLSSINKLNSFYAKLSNENDLIRIITERYTERIHDESNYIKVINGLIDNNVKNMEDVNKCVNINDLQKYMNAVCGMLRKNKFFDHIYYTDNYTNFDIDKDYIIIKGRNIPNKINGYNRVVSIVQIEFNNGDKTFACNFNLYNKYILHQSYVKKRRLLYTLNDIIDYKSENICISLYIREFLIDKYKGKQRGLESNIIVKPYELMHRKILNKYTGDWYRSNINNKEMMKKMKHAKEKYDDLLRFNASYVDYEKYKYMENVPKRYFVQGDSNCYFVTGMNLLFNIKEVYDTIIKYDYPGEMKVNIIKALKHIIINGDNDPKLRGLIINMLHNMNILTISYGDNYMLDGKVMDNLIKLIGIQNGLIYCGDMCFDGSNMCTNDVLYELITGNIIKNDMYGGICEYHNELINTITNGRYKYIYLHGFNGYHLTELPGYKLFGVYGGSLKHINGEDSEYRNNVVEGKYDTGIKGYPYNINLNGILDNNLVNYKDKYKDKSLNLYIVNNSLYVYTKLYKKTTKKCNMVITCDGNKVNEVTKMTLDTNSSYFVFNINTNTTFNNINSNTILIQINDNGIANSWYYDQGNNETKGKCQLPDDLKNRIISDVFDTIFNCKSLDIPIKYDIPDITEYASCFVNAKETNRAKRYLDSNFKQINESDLYEDPDTVVTYIKELDLYQFGLFYIYVHDNKLDMYKVREFHYEAYFNKHRCLMTTTQGGELEYGSYSYFLSKVRHLAPIGLWYERIDDD